MNAIITFIRRYLKPALISQIKELSEHIDDEHQDKQETCELSQELCNEQKQDNPINIYSVIFNIAGCAAYNIIHKYRLQVVSK